MGATGKSNSFASHIGAEYWYVTEVSVAESLPKYEFTFPSWAKPSTCLQPVAQPGFRHAAAHVAPPVQLYP